MDTRDSPEQAELRRSARKLAHDLGPAAVADLDDAARTDRLERAVKDAGWLELRYDSGDGSPLATGVEAGIVAEALGEAIADVPFAGPTLAADLARRAGLDGTQISAVCFDSDLIATALVHGGVTESTVYAVDCSPDSAGAFVVARNADHDYRLAEVRVTGGHRGADLTRKIRFCEAGAQALHVEGQRGWISDEDLAQWTALGLALTSADLVGVMRGVIRVTVEYAANSHQFGVPIGSFQAVQHVLAEAQCLMEGSASVALHASWAADNLEPRLACEAGRVAKAYCARAARQVCETAIQVHGGIGNTWDCIVHVYLRRALLSSQWLGDDRVQLLRLGHDRVGAA
ncbi:MAG: acyl-CoA dehydrogenase family protein [Acidimicrobiales bacterium]